MAKNKSILASNLKIKGDITEKDSLIVDGEIYGNINAETLESYENSNIKGNILTSESVIGGRLKGDINSNKVHIKKTADVEGTIKQKSLSIEEGSILKIKTEIKK
tara:strand:+ start:543 stop:857 length:315 start_codon:yes stop_codon:yes gene_type:complete